MNPPPKPWDRRPSEPSKSFRYFTAYLQLGEDRSHAVVAETIGEASVAVRTIERWSGKWDWVERANAFDADQLLDELKGRVRTREKVRQIFYREATKAAEDMVLLSQGLMPLGDAEPIMDKHLKVIGKRALVSASVRLQALQHILAMAGLVVPKRVEVDGVDGDELRMQARQALGALPPEVARMILEALKKRHAAPADELAA